MGPVGPRVPFLLVDGVRPRAGLAVVVPARASAGDEQEWDSANYRVVPSFLAPAGGADAVIDPVTEHGFEHWSTARYRRDGVDAHALVDADIGQHAVVELGQLPLFAVPRLEEQDAISQTPPLAGPALPPLRGGPLGPAGPSPPWRRSGLVLPGSAVLQLDGDVTLILTGSPSVSVTGSASISIPAGSKLTIYAAGDVTVAGRGLA